MSNKFDCKLEVERILKGDNEICGKLYSEMMAFLASMNKFGKVEKHVLNDIGQNAMVLFLLNLKNNKFKFQSTLSTYLKAIAKNEFYNYFNQTDEFLSIESTDLIDDLPNEVIIDNDNLDIKWAIYREEFDNLKKDCRRLIRFNTSKMNKAIIAERMGYSSVDMVRDRLYRCKLKLVQLIKSNKMYNKYLHHDNQTI